jgi:sorting nexin-27
MDHQSVVQLIRKSGNQVKMVVLSVSDDEARRLEPETTNSSSVGMDYYERRSVPVTVPTSKKMTDESGKEYVAFSICMASREIAPRRYREFDALSTNLKRQFSDFIFPKLPGKRPFALSDAQVDGRRRGLEDYLEKVCSAKVIFESDLMQDFLQLKGQNPQPGGGGRAGLVTEATAGQSSRGPAAEKKVQLRVLLPDKTVSTITVSEYWRTNEVYEELAEKIGLKENVRKFFTLFLRTGEGIDRKLQNNEFPHQVYLKEYTSSSGSDSCILLRKWLFSRTHEVLASSDSVALNLFYHQAVDDIGKGRIPCHGELAALKSFKAQGKKKEFLDLARSLPGYSTIVFPHCECDARKVGHVKVSLTLQQLVLQACSTDGEDELQSPSFSWDQITSYEADLEESAFTFLYTRGEGKDPRWVKVYSPFFRYMEECVDRINQEILWKQPDDVELTTKKTHTAGANPARSRAAKQQASITNDDL